MPLRQAPFSEVPAVGQWGRHCRCKKSCQPQLALGVVTRLSRAVFSAFREVAASDEPGKVTIVFDASPWEAGHD